MSTDADRRRDPQDSASSVRRWIDRVGSAPLWMHTLALGAVLVVILLATVPGYAFFTDEGAAILQEQQLRAGDGWIYEPPFESVDPQGLIRPFPLPHHETAAGVVPYVKHPLLPLVLGAADAIAGTPGMLLLVVAGATLAGLAAGLIGGRLDPRLAVPALWVVGVGSPLLFDAYLVLGHTIAAAAAGLATWFALRMLDRDGPGAINATGLVVAISLTVLLRSEGLAIAPAIAVAAGYVMWTDRTRRSRAITVLIVALAAAVVSVAIERIVIQTIAGDASDGARLITENFLLGRIKALMATWFSASGGQHTVLDLLLVASTGLLAIAAVRSARRKDATPIAFALGITTVILGLRAIVVGPETIPGLAVAFPIAWTGLWLMRRRYFRDADTRFVAIVAAIAVLAVFITQGPRGAGVEWGGRYFAFALPIITPIVLKPWLDVFRWPIRRRWWLPASMFAVIAMLAIVSVQTLRSHHAEHQLVMELMVTAGREAGPQDPAGTGDARPVIVAGGQLTGQLAWNIFHDHYFVTPEHDRPQDAPAVLARTDVTRIAVLGPESGPGRALWGDWEPVAVHSGGGYHVWVMERRR